MIHQLTLTLPPERALDSDQFEAEVYQRLHLSDTDPVVVRKKRQSIDARNRQVWVKVDTEVYIDETPPPLIAYQKPQHDVRQAPAAIVVGAGPAGLFAALRLIEHGIRPIVVERGSDVRARRRDLAAINKDHVVNPESNYCFGEGGAGTYSDGKLYTRSTKRGDVRRILEIFVAHGATDQILVDAHPHIGTNKLPAVVADVRESILRAGGEVYFDTKVTDLILVQGELKGVVVTDAHTQAQRELTGLGVILATGHSARDIFHLLHSRQVLIEAKPFAMGVRIEHQQQLIDRFQYHRPDRGAYLPAASYSLVTQTRYKGVERGVFSFCMCPGGIIAPAATSPGELVVNGWSPSKRNNPYANSGMVVQVEQNDAFQFFEKRKWTLPDGTIIPKNTSTEKDPLLLMHFQQAVEQSSFQAGGGHFVAPAQRMMDFCSGKLSNNLPDCSYVPGLSSTPLEQVLPDFIYKSLQGGFQAFGKKMRGYYTNDAVVVATESRTSSPVRIPRDADTLTHPQIINLFPCGEGAGYAGGIVSAAMDGERVADRIIKKGK